MRVQLLIATTDADYTEHLSENITERYADVISVSVCSSAERLRELLSTRKFDAALLEAPMSDGADISSIRMPLCLWTEDNNSPDIAGSCEKIRKYQRISSIVAEVLGKYAKVSTGGRGFNSEKVQITAVWSPAGGVGKTTVALAWSAKKASEGKQVLYLNVESFSSVPVYFPETGKSISTVFEMLENNAGNIEMLIRGIRQTDKGTGVSYFRQPENFDDMNILSSENISTLVEACAGVTEELIVDMSGICDERTQQIFRLADKVLLVTDMTPAARSKLEQFAAQSGVFQTIREKAILVANKGAAIDKPIVDEVIKLPLVQSADANEVYNTLSKISLP